MDYKDHKIAAVLVDDDGVAFCQIDTYYTNQITRSNTKGERIAKLNKGFNYTDQTKLVDIPQIISHVQNHYVTLLLDVNRNVWVYGKLARKNRPTFNITALKLQHDDGFLLHPVMLNMLPIVTMMDISEKAIYLLDMQNNLLSVKISKRNNISDNETIFDGRKLTMNVRKISCCGDGIAILDNNGKIYYSVDDESYNFLKDSINDNYFDTIRLELSNNDEKHSLASVDDICLGYDFSHGYQLLILDKEGNVWYHNLEGDLYHIPSVTNIKKISIGNGTGGMMLDVQNIVWYFFTSRVSNYSEGFEGCYSGPFSEYDSIKDITIQNSSAILLSEDDKIYSYESNMDGILQFGVENSTTRLFSGINITSLTAVDNQKRMLNTKKAV